MTGQTIQCPKCGTAIPLTEALTGQIESTIKAKYEAEAVQKDNEVQAKLKEINQQAKALEEKQQTIDQQINEQLKSERKKIAEQEKAKILSEQAEQTRALQDELDKKRKQLSDANKKELELRQQQQKLEEEKEAFELTVQRKLDEERKKIAEDAVAKAANEVQLKIKEKDQLIESLRKQAQDWQRRAEQGSQEAQGEALEGALQESLVQAFPFDIFAEVKKGQRGADIIQTVRNANGKECGKIVWEAKYTKNYSGAWIDKLKSDQQSESADVAVLTTMALPKEIKNFGTLDGIWITDYASVFGLATALRIGLINAAKEKTLSANQDTVKDVIYRYVTGQEFAMQIRAIAEAFGRMKDELDKEKRAMEKIWKSREKQIETVLSNVSGIQGSLQGYLGQKVLADSGVSELENIPE
jgi:hypothetical protein